MNCGRAFLFLSAARAGELGFVAEIPSKAVSVPEEVPRDVTFDSLGVFG
jgi:hypothetical protein